MEDQRVSLTALSLMSGAAEMDSGRATKGAKVDAAAVFQWRGFHGHGFGAFLLFVTSAARDVFSALPAPQTPRGPDKV